VNHGEYLITRRIKSIDRTLRTGVFNLEQWLSLSSTDSKSAIAMDAPLAVKMTRKLEAYSTYLKCSFADRPEPVVPSGV